MVEDKKFVSLVEKANTFGSIKSSRVIENLVNE